MGDQEGSQKKRRLEVLPTADEGDETYCTFVLHGEDHTLGNALSHVIRKDPQTAFCGYNVPHPSEHKILLRIQTNGESATAVLERGLTRLNSLCQHVLDTFEVSAAQFVKQSRDDDCEAKMDTS